MGLSVFIFIIFNIRVLFLEESFVKIRVFVLFLFYVIFIVI